MAEDAAEKYVREHSQFRTWMPLSSGLRWRAESSTSTKPPVLQEQWICHATGEREWRDVPTIVTSDNGGLSPIQR